MHEAARLRCGPGLRQNSSVSCTRGRNAADRRTLKVVACCCLAAQGIQLGRLWSCGTSGAVISQAILHSDSLCCCSLLSTPSIWFLSGLFWNWLCYCAPFSALPRCALGQTLCHLDENRLSLNLLCFALLCPTLQTLQLQACMLNAGCVEFDELELGSRRGDTEWVAFAPPLVTRPKHSPFKRWGHLLHSIKCLPAPTNRRILSSHCPDQRRVTLLPAGTPMLQQSHS